MMMITLSMTSVDMPLPAPVSCGVIHTWPRLDIPFSNPRPGLVSF